MASAIAWSMIDTLRGKLPVDEARALQTIATIADQTPLSVQENIGIAMSILQYSHYPEAAYPYLADAVTIAAAGDDSVTKLLADLDHMGRNEWSERLRALREAER